MSKPYDDLDEILQRKKQKLHGRGGGFGLVPLLYRQILDTLYTEAMGKNAHPPRVSKPSKKAASEVPAASSSQPKDASDKKKVKATSEATDPPAEPEAKKKPDTRTLIGGASWTGKLPVNLLSEHCQKQRWEKPEYTMSKTPDGFSSMVILKSKNPKTQELSTLPPFKLPPTHKHLAFQPSAVEARHFAAAYALFRVCSMRNIHLTMPPTYRDLWKGDFLELKKEDVENGRAWMYEADPFLAQREREEAQKQKEKNRLMREQQQAAAASQPGTANLANGSKGASMKGWATAAKVEMGTRTRREVERITRTYSTWNPQQLRISPTSRAELISELQNLGFRTSHVEEAADICKDREEVLEWLLIHVPEDDLPTWCLPEGYVAGVSMASGDLKRDSTVKRLASGGFATELCQAFYDKFSGDEARAAQALQDTLLEESSKLSNLTLKTDTDDMTNPPDPWTEEQDVISSIYEKKYERTGASSCRIRLEIPSIDQTIYCCIRRPQGPYPAVAPILTIDASLPAYIRLSVTRSALEFVLGTLLGEQMIFNIVDWLEHETPGIIANPGLLAKVASVGSSVALEETSTPVATSQKRKRHPAPLKQNRGSDVSRSILSDWQNRQKSAAQQKMLQIRQSLPAWQLQEAIVNAVETHQVVIISGETGSGKSTQSVQFLLDDMIKQELGEATNIICTQPRRISALGLADRVSEERCSTVGQEIGYAIRGEAKQSHGKTKITFVTTGILLRRLQMSGGSTKDVVASLADVSHVVVDEVHERSLDTDFLLALLRDVLRVRKDLKLILMSATLDANIFEQYFGGPRVVGKVEIQGRTFPVDDYYLDDVIRLTQNQQQQQDQDMEDGDSNIGSTLQKLGMGINYDMIGELVQRIDHDLGSMMGGILVFLPGTAEINRTLDRLRNIPRIHALPLHASLLPSEQRRVFPPAPSGKRKVIVSTNVAETSITIEDVVAVIDTGRVKETRYDPQANMVKLEEVWASLAACKQRRGRAGRVRAGKCYKLFTRNAESKMMERPDPEIRRVPLEQLCLSVKSMGVQDVPHFLKSTITPPESIAIEGALTLLQRIGALEGDYLTSLGRHLSMIPADLRCAKLMVFGALFGYLEECVTIASILSVRSPFISPQNKRDESKAARTSFGQNQGDVIADLCAYIEWLEVRSISSSREVRLWCEQNFLSTPTLNDISSTRSQYLSSLKEIGFIPFDFKSQPMSRPASYAFLNSLILSSLHPQILRITLPAQRYQSTVSGALPVDPESREIKYFDSENSRVFIHPSSTLFSAQSFPNNAGFLSFFQKVETSKIFVRELTPCGSYGLLLFGGPIEVDTQGRGLVVDGWTRLRGWARIGVLVSRLRGILDRVLESWIETPSFGAKGEMERSLVEIAKKLIELEGMDR